MPYSKKKSKEKTTICHFENKFRRIPYLSTIVFVFNSGITVCRLRLGRKYDRARVSTRPRDRSGRA